MTWGITIGVVMAAAVSTLLALQTSRAVAGDPAGDPNDGPLGITLDDSAVTWSYVPSAASYRLSGYVSYWPAPACRSFNVVAAAIEEEVPAESTRFQLPDPPPDPNLTWRKNLQVTIEALDAEGQVLVTDGIAYQADKFCTEEEIAVELAAAGTGGFRGGTTLPSLITVGLVIVGALALFGGLLALRKRA